MSRLRVTDDAIDLVALCRPLCDKLARKSPELAKQLRRSLISIPLNIAEGDGRWDGNGRQRLLSAMFEARESHVSVEVALAAGFVEAEEAAAPLAVLDKIAATLWKLVGRRAE